MTRCVTTSDSISMPCARALTMELFPFSVVQDGATCAAGGEPERCGGRGGHDEALPAGQPGRRDRARRLPPRRRQEQAGTPLHTHGRFWLVAKNSVASCNCACRSVLHAGMQAT